MESLRAQGRFQDFVERAFHESDQRPDDPALQLARSEAHLAVGDSASAESAALQAAMLAVEVDDPGLAVQALRLWIVARLRQKKTLASEGVARALAAEGA